MIARSTDAPIDDSDPPVGQGGGGAGESCPAQGIDGPESDQHHYRSFAVPSERVESGLSAIREARLRARAIRDGWLKGSRWPTGKSINEISAEIAGRGGTMSIREQATLTAAKDLGAEDARIRQIAVKSIVQMERQNAEDEHAAVRAADPAPQEHDPAAAVTVNVNVNSDDVAAERRRRLADLVARFGPAGD